MWYLIVVGSTDSLRSETLLLSVSSLPPLSNKVSLFCWLRISVVRPPPTPEEFLSGFIWSSVRSGADLWPGDTCASRPGKWSDLIELDFSPLEPLSLSKLASPFLLLSCSLDPTPYLA